MSASDVRCDYIEPDDALDLVRYRFPEMSEDDLTFLAQLLDEVYLQGYNSTDGGWRQ